MKAVILRSAARDDVRQAFDYYRGAADEDTARGFVQALREAGKLIGRYPALGSPRYAELLGIAGLRCRALRRYPYLVFYFERPDHIDLWRVLHAAADIPAWL